MPKGVYDETKTFDLTVAVKMGLVAMANLALSAAVIFWLYACVVHVLNAAKLDKEINNRTSWQFILGVFAGFVAGTFVLGSPESAKYLNKYAPEGTIETLDPVPLLGDTVLSSGMVIAGAYSSVGASKALRFMTHGISVANDPRSGKYNQVPARVSSTSPTPR